MPQPRGRIARFRQYSLRTLLAALTAAGVCSGVLAQRAEKQRRAVAAIPVGGRVVYDCEYGLQQDEAQPPGPAWLRELLGRDWFDTVVCVSLDEATSADIALLPQLPEVHTVGIRCQPAVDLTPLAELRRLKELSLADSFFHPGGATPVDLAPVARIENLEQLHVFGFDRVDLSPLNTSPRLQTIILRHVEEVGLEGFTGPDTLGVLEITDSPINDISALADVKNLTELNLQNTLVEDLSPLAGMSKLRRLNVDGTQVKELSPLKELTRLQVLNVDATPVTFADMQEFERQLPGCSVSGWTQGLHARRAWQGSGGR